MNQQGNETKKLLGKNTLYNFLGSFLPSLLGIVVIPPLIKSLGDEKFGILTLIWAIIGYFSLFDLGLGKVITFKYSSQNYDNESFWSMQGILILFTTLGSFIMIILTKFTSLFSSNVSPTVLLEYISSLQIMSINLPLIGFTNGFKGFLEAKQEFLGLNIIQAVQSSLTFVMPYLLSSFFSTNLIYISLGVTLGRVITCIILIYFTYKSYPSLIRFKLKHLKPKKDLLQISSWYTVTNVVGPIMSYSDRFFLATFFPMQKLAYYTTPFEITSRLLIIPASFSRALFPTFAKHQFHLLTHKLYFRSLRLMLLLMLPVGFVVCFFAKMGFTYWLNRDFATQATPIFYVLISGIVINSIAWIPFTLIQSLGRPDLTAKLHLFELPMYLSFLYILTHRFGLIGASYAWSLRNLIDLVLLLVISQHILNKR